MLKRGDYVIMNDMDCPEARLVAVLTRYDDYTGVWHAFYLATYTNMAAPHGTLPTLLSAFGQRVEWKGETYRVVTSGEPVTARYRDGRPRKWQDRFGEGRWWDARKRAVQICRKFAAVAA